MGSTVYNFVLYIVLKLQLFAVQFRIIQAFGQIKTTKTGTVLSETVLSGDSLCTNFPSLQDSYKRLLLAYTATLISVFLDSMDIY